MSVDPAILQRLQQARIPKAKKSPTPIAKQSEKKKAQLKEEKESGINLPLQKYFEYWMIHAEPVCAECGMEAHWLKTPEYIKIWKACQAHIVPKKKGAFPSQAGNLDNHIVLFPSWGGHLCGCHGFYDSNWFNASTMKIWPEVSKIFIEKIYPKIPQSEHKNLPEQLTKLIEK